MASTKAVHDRFGRLDPYELARKELFAEGISSSKIYLDPLRPGLEDLLDMITSGVRSSFTYAGASIGRGVPRARARRPAVRRRLRRGQGAPGQLVSPGFGRSACRRLVATMDDPPSCRPSPHRPAPAMSGGDA